MDNSLVPRCCSNARILLCWILILVVMDNSLVPSLNLDYMCKYETVLILVVMDNSLVPYYFAGINPYEMS